MFGKKKSKEAKEEKAEKKAKKNLHKKSKLMHFLKALNNMGLGKERSAVIQNMAMMMDAGLQITEALDTLSREAPKRPVKKIMRNVMREVDNGNALWRAMDSQAFFTPYSIAMIRIGEESGNLAENLQNLAAQDEKSESMKQKVKTAMIYPTIIICITVIIGVGLSWFVLPQLVGVLYALGAELPTMTIVIIKISEFFTDNGSTVVPIGLVVAIVTWVLMKFTPARVVGQWVVLHIPGIKTLVECASIAQFGIILGSLLDAGVPPVQALESLTEVTTMVRYKKFYAKLTEHVKVGDSFAKSFQEIRGSKAALPVSVQQIIATGERSGKLSFVLNKVADIYLRKAEATAEKLPVILEPMLLIFVAGLVGVIAFSILMPIYSVVGNIG